jgi:hypothetical protein
MCTFGLVGLLFLVVVGRRHVPRALLFVVLLFGVEV